MGSYKAWSVPKLFRMFQKFLEHGGWVPPDPHKKERKRKKNHTRFAGSGVGKGL